jgi:hypothetical protein
MEALCLPRDWRPRMRSVQPDRHRGLEVAGVVQAPRRNAKYVASAGKKRRAAFRAKLARYIPAALGEDRVALGPPFHDCNRPQRHEHKAGERPTGTLLTIGAIAEAHPQSFSVALVPYGSATAPTSAYLSHGRASFSLIFPNRTRQSPSDRPSFGRGWTARL